MLTSNTSLEYNLQSTAVILQFVIYAIETYLLQET